MQKEVKSMRKYKMLRNGKSWISCQVYSIQEENKHLNRE